MSPTAPVPKPRPVVAPWGKHFWDECRAHRLVLQYCPGCDLRIFYPRMACPRCLSTDLGWVEASGRGTVYSYTVVEANAPSAFVQDVPYVVAVIRLEEGVQMLSNVVDTPHEALRCDLPVEVVFERLDDEFTLPKFRAARDR